MLLTRIKISALVASAVMCISTFVEANSVSLHGYRGFFPSDVDKFLHVNSIKSPFIENYGQADARISFYRLTASGMALVTTSGELLYTIHRQSQEATNKKTASFRVQFEGGNAFPVGRAKYNPLVNYYLGNEIRKTRANFPVYDSLVLGEVWPGINVSLHAQHNRVGKHFAVRAGGDIASIQMKISYAHELAIAGNGALVVLTAAGPVKFRQPNAYQIHDGKKEFVPIRYRVEELTYGFSVEYYDRNKPLFISPLEILNSEDV